MRYINAKSSVVNIKISREFIFVDHVLDTHDFFYGKDYVSHNSHRDNGPSSVNTKPTNADVVTLLYIKSTSKTIAQLHTILDCLLIINNLITAILTKVNDNQEPVREGYAR